ncbi:MAG: phage tail protein [Acidobacteria bacterium]|nr:phage tail protein [Acidobacteriota bacterium]MBV9184842.1 phage tail protein [Acidobacteriota bacterium]
MSSPYVGEIRMFGGSFAPAGWAMCAGQLMPISQNDTLFNLIGTTYGGDGQETFGLPDVQGRLPIHMGTNPQTGTTYQIGEMAGVEQVTLTTQQIPQHNHALVASTSGGTTGVPTGNVLASNLQVSLYSQFPPSNNFNAAAITSVGGSQPHENMMPFLVITFIISLFGIFPTQN